MIFLLAACLGGLNGVQAQTRAEKEVAAAVEVLRKAMVDADQATLKSITDPALTYGHSGGNIQNQATFIENILNGNSDFVTIDLKDQTIHVDGDVAIVRHRLVADTNDRGKPGKVDLLILTVWKKKKGRWLLLARQAVHAHN